MASPPFPVQWLTWPIAFIASIGLVLHADVLGVNMVAVSGACIVGTALLLIGLEFVWPVEDKWCMTWRSFARDIQFFAVNGATIFATNLAFAWIGVELGKGHSGVLTGVPLFLSVPVAIFVVDFFQYWQHRIAHEAPGPFGRFLWRSHAAHHLPEQVYVLMHPAGHPVNTFIVRGLVTILPLYLLGASAETVVLANMVIGIQGLFSHTNLDLRAGWFNYIFVGTELHRYHHSADTEESGNYAVALSLIDILFGSFIYRPGRVPEQLGVYDPDSYPRSGQVARIMLLPFLVRRQNASTR
ncbi:MAG: sterol desaturase family protein [Salaquimonas sp.]|nr:sterol desaturase family protein [Salaquimonas sp.]